LTIQTRYQFTHPVGKTGSGNAPEIIPEQVERRPAAPGPARILLRFIPPPCKDTARGIPPSYRNRVLIGLPARSRKISVCLLVRGRESETGRKKIPAIFRICFFEKLEAELPTSVVKGRIANAATGIETCVAAKRIQAIYPRVSGNPMNLFIKTIIPAVALSPLPAGAVSIDVSYPDQDIVRAALYEIDDIDDRVYTIRFDEDGSASIGFGDGIRGARPSPGGGVVASYRFGTGLDGKIVNEYQVAENELPVIPIVDFWPSGVKQPEASFILAGLTAIEFDFSLEGLQVIDAELLSAAVPVPATVWLFGTALIGLIGFCTPGKTSSSDV
jgi:hypothetical protein